MGSMPARLLAPKPGMCAERWIRGWGGGGCHEYGGVQGLEVGGVVSQGMCPAAFAT